MRAHKAVQRTGELLGLVLISCSSRISVTRSIFESGFEDVELCDGCVYGVFVKAVYFLNLLHYSLL